MLPGQADQPLTMFGDSASDLVVDNTRRTPRALKKFHKLTKETKRKKRHLAQSSMPPPLPPLRRAVKSAAGEAAANRRRLSVAGEAAAKRRRLSLRARIQSTKTKIFVLGSPLPAAVAQNFVLCASPAQVDMVVVPRVTDLDTGIGGGRLESLVGGRGNGQSCDSQGGLAPGLHT